jgi:hypothetical protein
MNSAPLKDIGHVIQLAIAPVFLLSAISTLLGVLSGRLARVIDRQRSLAFALTTTEGAATDLVRREHQFQLRRARVIYTAITMAVVSAFCVAMIICLAFVDAFVSADLKVLVALFFVLATVALAGSLATFLREIFLALNSPDTPIR